MFHSDQHAIKDAVASSGESGIPARLTQSLWGPPQKEEKSAGKSEGVFADLMKTADDMLYGQAYAQTLRGEDKPQTEASSADAKVPTGFPPAKIVAGEDGYIDFGAANYDEVAAKRDAKQFANFVDNRLAA